MNRSSLDVSRRTFAKQSLGSLLAFSLLETLFERDAWADKIKPAALAWLRDVNQLGMDLRGHKIKQADWQKKVEELLADVNLPELLKLIDFEKLTSNVKFVDKGARSLRFRFQQIEGAPQQFAYGKQVFALKKGRSVVPHGHNNMSTAFIILQGEFHGRHYDRIEDEDDHMLIKPTIDRRFKPGEYSTITDFKDNVHWFKAESEPAFVFNIHALKVNAKSRKFPGRVYVDPAGEKVSGGLIRAPLLNHKQAHKLYG